MTLTTASCGDDDGGDPSGDPNDAAASDDGSTGSIDGGDPADAAPPDAGESTLSCAPSGDCELGPACGDRCCGQGEACVEGRCRCGDGRACKDNQTCAAGGPEGDDACGFICCGPGGPPCPQ